jgi:DNA-binding transcriptional ArsR family regulator
MQPCGCIISPQMDAVFKRWPTPKLLDELRKENGQTLSELCEHLDMRRQAVTKHLVLPEKANLIAVVWRGREKLHYINPMPLPAGALGVMIGIGVPLLGVAAATGLVLFFVVAIVVVTRARWYSHLPWPATYLFLAVASLALQLLVS